MNENIIMKCGKRNMGRLNNLNKGGHKYAAEGALNKATNGITKLNNLHHIQYAFKAKI
jgi:hypothetical protein